MLYRCTLDSHKLVILEESPPFCLQIRFSGFCFSKGLRSNMLSLNWYKVDQGNKLNINKRLFNKLLLFFCLS